MELNSVQRALVHLRGELYRRSTDPDLETAHPSSNCPKSLQTNSLCNLHSDGTCLSNPDKDNLTDLEDHDKTCCGSFTSSATTLTMSSQTIQLPEQRYPYEWMNKWRWKTFLTYHRINTVVLLTNMSLIVAFSCTSGALWSIPVDEISTALAANILLTVITRNELVVNFLFLVFGCLSHRLPLRFRQLAAKVYHFGGVHSGGAFAAVLWLAVFNVNIIRIVWTDGLDKIKGITCGTTLVIDFLLVLIISTSMPEFRSKSHNTWECIHRYGGWTMLVLFWAQFGVSTHAKTPDGAHFLQWTEIIMKSPLFWILFLITFCIVWPWLRLKKVDVRAEPLSEHAIQLHFDYTNIAFCVAPRLSDNPWREWHSFAAIPSHDGYGYSVIVSRSGDWTSKIIDNPPKKLWIRSIPVRGVLHIAPIFKSMVLVATGSGIGPVLSLLYARKVNCRILWSTKTPLDTFREEVCKQVVYADPQAVIFDTTRDGRPNLVEEAYRLYAELQAEAVFVISNPKLSTELVYNLESRGVPCFAPIFDS